MGSGMVKRSIITVDVERCDGCGACVPSCPEGALKIINGKLHVLEGLCDGLGACLGACPKGALTIEQKETEEFNPNLYKVNLNEPGWDETKLADARRSNANIKDRPTLSQWPIKLELVNPHAPFFKDSNLLVAADCAPIACRDFHRQFLSGRKIVTGCPKFGDVNLYLQKLTEILKSSRPKTLKVVRMEVPCCGGLKYIAERAAKSLEQNASPSLEEAIINIDGKIIKDVKIVNPNRTPTNP